jgi:hypothetical protein
MPTGAGTSNLRRVSPSGKEGEKVTIVWFVVWLVCDLVGDREPLRFDPLNWWAATLLLAFALDVNRPQVIGRRR